MGFKELDVTEATEHIGMVDFQCVLASGVQQSESVIQKHVSILFQILFPHRSLQNVG